MTDEDLKWLQALLPDDNEDFISLKPVSAPFFAPLKSKCDLCEEETESKDLYEISRCCCYRDNICHKCMNTVTLKDFYNALVANDLTPKVE